MNIKAITISILTLSFLSCAGTVPSTFWNDKDITAFAKHVEGSRHTVLIATRDSKFKRELMNRLIDSLNRDSISVDAIGIGSLKDTTKLTTYSAVVFINTVVAWEFENQVKNFISKHKEYSGFIVMSTTGNKTFKLTGSKVPAGVDAITSASLSEKIGEDVSEILVGIKKRIAAGN